MPKTPLRKADVSTIPILRRSHASHSSHASQGSHAPRASRTFSCHVLCTARVPRLVRALTLGQQVVGEPDRWGSSGSKATANRLGTGREYGDIWTSWTLRSLCSGAHCHYHKLNRHVHETGPYKRCFYSGWDEFAMLSSCCSAGGTSKKRDSPPTQFWRPRIPSSEGRKGQR